MDPQKLNKEAKKLRESAANAYPQPLGSAMSFGFGDRLGLATPGHIAALRACRPKGLMPVFAQQSIRELVRTGRTAQEVIDAATVAVHQAGWTEPWGADADHLKTEADIQLTYDAGFTMFTLDPSDAIDGRGAEMNGKELVRAFDALYASKADRKTYLDRYAGGEVEFDTGETLFISEEETRRVAVIYLRAIAHIVNLVRYLESIWKKEPRFDLEISIDETETPTTPEAHWIIASELDRAGVYFNSLAPRFVGRFEKGVDYRGSIDELELHIAEHAKIASTLGPYKLSLHSGSDKFSVYPMLVEYAGDSVHVKTAGTSYLEALRVVCRRDPALFREILALSEQVFVTARDTYHLTTDVDKIPSGDEVTDAELENEFLRAPQRDDARQMLHVAFGDVLKDPDLGVRVRTLLEANEDEHAACLETHFVKHLEGLA